MKYFSLNYVLTEKDYQNYNKMLSKTLILSRIKLLILPVFIFIIIGFMVDFLDIFSTALMIIYIPVFLFMTVILNWQYYKVVLKKSKTLKRQLSLDFYDDHIEEKYMPDEYFKGYTQRYYGFKDVQHITETNENIFIFLNDNTMINIPKRILDNENYTMLQNMISNLFKNKYELI